MLAHHHNSAVRAIDIAISVVDREEQRLRAVMESDSSSGEERFQALQDLAYLSGVVVRELADIGSESTGRTGPLESHDATRRRCSAVDGRNRRKPPE